MKALNKNKNKDKSLPADGSSLLLKLSSLLPLLGGQQGQVFLIPTGVTPPA